MQLNLLKIFFQRNRLILYITKQAALLLYKKRLTSDNVISRELPFDIIEYNNT